MTSTKKTTYTATAPNGQKITRTSHRVYTHAVIVRDSVEYAEAELARVAAIYAARPDAYRGQPDQTDYYRRQVADAKAERWGAVGFCGRADLAEKLFSKWVGYPGHAETLIVPVVAA